MIKPNRFAVAITGLLLSATIASAQGTLTEADIINSLVETGPAMQAAGFDVAAIQKALFERIQVEGTESAARPMPVLQALSKYPNLTVQVEFDFDSDWIRPSSWETVGLIADGLHHPLLLTSRFAVIGHTDAKGSRDYNLKLSQRRAEAVMEMLVTTFRVPPDQLVALGVGEEQPADPANPDAAINRRVQLINIGPR
ncbi:MAG: OmpA family protein [Bauldia sp.]|uniref:OmpA family protein n=1 Tax=Bauldia sp. TaxID=2575872 RepID=UPI001DD23081|nr:OmpA family protein [Bauldia sp.]MCB1495912.1 OmpA family protein [Bauldia sp.]